jgi:2-polyprenyl-3-methyl-5-hydroxy-6-metoxy-1,4-benzoquinol methylase
MNRFSARSNEVEIMDDLNCSGEVVHQTLRELDIINRWLGGNRITLQGIETLTKTFCNKNQRLTIADIGCGSGDMLMLIHNFLSKKGIPHTLEGVDANRNIIDYAKRETSGINTITFREENILDESFRARQFDIVTATLFLHHFNLDELVDILRGLYNQVGVGIVINDLHRHPIAYYAIKLLTHLFSKSAMVKYDAPLSVLRGFRKHEWLSLLERAGIKSYSLQWRWAFRWQLLIYH